MYEAFFGLNKRPFSATPDPDCCFAPESLQAIVDEVVLRTQSGQGISVITAPAGTGKTLFCRRLVQELGTQYTCIFLAHTGFVTRRAFFQAVNYELDRRYSGMEEQELRLELVSTLRALLAEGRPAVLIVDEAHHLTGRLLEEIRTLATLSERGAPLLRVVLAGQLALEERLAEPELEALNQRIACHRSLEPLSRGQSIEYIAHRLQWAGGDTAQIIEPAALDYIAQASNGLPRCINQLADHGLLLAYAKEERPASRETLVEALEDLKQLPLQWHLRPEADSPTGAAGWSQPFTGEPAERTGIAESTEHQAPPATTIIEVGAPQPAIKESEPAAIDDLALKPEEVPAPAADWTLRLPDRSPRAAALPAEARPPATGTAFEEETVSDLYAALDSRRHVQGAMTFDDLAHAGAARGAAALEKAISRAPQARTSGSVDEAGASAVQRLDEVVELIELTRSADLAPWPDRNENDQRDTAAWVAERKGAALAQGKRDDARCGGASWDESATEVRFIDAFETEREEIESEVGGQALDACLDLQHALARSEPVRSNAEREEEINLPTGNEGSGSEFEPIDYDVIQPDSPAMLAAPPMLSAAASPRAEEPKVPTPNYRRVFSTLRRKALQAAGQHSS